ncbi:hypothetical protein ACE1CI_27125 [Aerosakkonemataceae cyanobacterium BLCC-F50]|uniref:Uncharacterized protein n=1 Tax=Floridaenema flaviceps BLCC-F50 TaxID=3153642 RepID=A0ABV4XY21_9CYAN
MDIKFLSPRYWKLVGEDLSLGDNAFGEGVRSLGTLRELSFSISEKPQYFYAN